MQESFIKSQAADCWKLGGCTKEMLLCALFSPVICPRFLCLRLSERRGRCSQLGDGYNTLSSSRERITGCLTGQIHYLTQQEQALGNKNQSQASEGLSYLIESLLRQRAGLSLGFRTSANVKLLLYLQTLLLVQTEAVRHPSGNSLCNFPLPCSAIRCYL